MLDILMNSDDPPAGGDLSTSTALRSGAQNLIEGCLGDVAGKTILVVAEDPALGWYDSAAPACVKSVLAEMGAVVRTIQVGAPQNHAIDAVQQALDTADEAIFFARIGDQGRFKPQYRGPRSVMSYALNAGMLASGYGTLDHKAMIALKNAVDEVTLGAHHIRVTCPLGTDFEGSPGESLTTGGEVVVSRYPMGVPKPVLANNFNGVVKLTHYLTPTGSKVYEPAFLSLPDVVTAHIEGTRIADVTGPADLVANFRQHYDHVAAQFGLDAYNIDSWHAGIHPLMGYDMAAKNDPVRWSQTVFSNPRLLHFHTCGMGPPGEICWMIVDPTITIDGTALWENGRLHPERFASTRKVLEASPGLAEAFASPVDAIGLESMA
ncbi:MAG: hypothetical protein EBT93_01685 [Alphaproteobacteria bacterium]|jgi:hypothetical protein|nr:hypothetical protein [Alphaproteobacteria bacterium]